MNYFSFDGEIAKEYGVEEAILYQFFMFWIKKNVANNKHQYDGYTWTYNSQQALTELFPFWNRQKIQRLLKSLEDKGLIVKGNYNQKTYDRTTWYALPKFEQSIVQNQTRDCLNSNTPLSKSEQPIPVNYHLTNHLTNQLSSISNISNNYSYMSDENNNDVEDDQIVYEFYQQNLGSLSPYTIERLDYWIKDLNPLLVKLALEKTIASGVRNIKYTESILRDWKSKNVKTVEDVQSLELEFNQRKNNKNHTQPKEQIDFGFKTNSY